MNSRFVSNAGRIWFDDLDDAFGSVLFKYEHLTCHSEAVGRRILMRPYMRSRWLDKKRFMVKSVFTSGTQRLIAISGIRHYNDLWVLLRYAPFKMTSRTPVFS
jgi:hypothetical protein